MSKRKIGFLEALLGEEDAENGDEVVETRTETEDVPEIPWIDPAPVRTTAPEPSVPSYVDEPPQPAIPPAGAYQPPAAAPAARVTAPAEGERAEDIEAPAAPVTEDTATDSDGGSLPEPAFLSPREVAAAAAPTPQAETPAPPAPVSAPARTTTAATTEQPTTEQPTTDLHDVDARRRLQALRDLPADLDADALSEVAELLLDPEADVRAAALDVLERASDSAPVEKVAAARFDVDADLRGRVLHQLGRTGAAEVLTHLAAAMASEDDPTVAATALTALADVLEGNLDENLDDVTGDVVAGFGVLAPRADIVEDLSDKLTAVARRLGREGITEALTDSDSRTRRGAALCATIIGDPDAEAALARLAGDPDTIVASLASSVQAAAGTRHEAVEGKERAAARALISVLSDPNPTLRENAKQGLAALPSDKLFEWIIEDVDIDTPDGIETLATLASQLDLGEALPTLARAALDHERGDTRNKAIATLRRVEGTAAVIDGWMSGSTDERADAVRLSVLLDPDTPSADRAFDDPSAVVRTVAVESAAQEIDRNADRLAHIVREDPSAQVRIAAIEAFADADPETRLSVAISAFDDTDATVRRAAVGLLSTATDEEMSLLVRALRDDGPVSSRATEVLARAQEPDTLASLWSELRSDGVPQPHAMQVLLSFDPDALLRLAKRALVAPSSAERALGVALISRLPGFEPEQLFGALTDPDATVRLEALRSFARHPFNGGIELIAQRLTDPVSDVRMLAVEAISEVDDERVAAWLLEACRDPIGKVKTAAADAILRRTSPSVIRMLIEKLSTIEFGQSAAELLERMLPAATTELVLALDTADDRQRTAIADVLSDAGQLTELAKWLDDVDPERRRKAVIALGATQQSSDVTAMLIARLDDPVSAIRSATADALARLGNHAAIEPLTRLLVSDPDMNVVAAAERALHALGQAKPAKERNDD